MLNYLALMGWTMPDEREVFTLDEFVANFELPDIRLGGPVFDLTKLGWLNGRYIRELDTADLLGRLRAGLLSDDYLLKVLPLAHERIDVLEDFISYAGFFFTGEVAYDDAARAALVAKDRTPVETAKAFRVLLEEQLDPIPDWSAATVEEAMRAFCEASGWTTKQLFMPVRVAVTGRAATPPLFETMAVLGKEVCRRRLRAASELLRVMTT
jgi:glutamyl-tRNA synthetase